MHNFGFICLFLEKWFSMGSFWFYNKTNKLHRLIRPACHLVPGWLGSHPSFDFVSVSPLGQSFTAFNGPPITSLSIVLHLSPCNCNSQPYCAGLWGFIHGVHKGTQAMH